ncbi:MAG: ABC transporter substrate-binding protein, partial [Chloroflexi bacterium]|nr:ABC transporter substrate-binding protein [Chloroflexota bacterium]
CGGDAAPPSSAPTADAPPATEAVAAGFPVTIVGSDGHSITLDRAPTRIVSHSPGATESLFAIGAGEQVVATDEFSDYPPAVSSLERVSYTDPDPERALALAPDLVILAEQQQQQVEQFRQLGLPVLFAREPDSVEGVFDSILMLGRATGHEPAAQALVSDMQRRIGVVAARIADVERGPTVFYELTDDLYTAAPDTFIGGMLALLRAENVAAGAASPFPQLTAEAVLAADPQVVLLADGEWVSVESVAQRPGWAGVAAVTSGRIYPINPDLGNRPGPRIVDAIEQMARAIYPERFPEGATAATP